MTVRSGLGNPSCGADSEGRQEPPDDIYVRNILSRDFDDVETLPIPDPLVLRRIKTMWRSGNTEEILGIFIRDTLTRRDKLKGLVIASLYEKRIQIHDVFSEFPCIVHDAWKLEGKIIKSSRG